jgi:hypothetical protein
MATPFDTDQAAETGMFMGFSKDRLGEYKAYKRNQIQRNK